MSNSGRIVKNTFALYVRSVVVLAISLYTSRVTLRVLGVEDFGIYNVVGGIIGLLSFMNNSMQATFQTYFNIDLGKKEYDKLILDIKTSLTVQLFLGLIILVVGETAGVWWLENKMIIPESRMYAARWIYQVSIASFLLSVFSAPFGALITAYEKMHVYAVISVLDSVLRLAAVLVLPFFAADKLVVYALLLLAISIFNLLFYVLYCINKIEVTTFTFNFDSKSIKQMASFSGWSMFGTISYTLKNHGVNLLLNLFFGPIVNAARGVAIQVNNAVNQFVSNFQTAFRPQLTQSYSSGDKEYMERMYFSASKLSYYMIFFISLPLLLEMNYVLHLWLGENVPLGTVVFTRIILVTTFVSAFSNPTSAIAFATGKIKRFSIMVGSLNIMIVPVAYMFLKIGYGPTSAFIVSLVFSILVLLLQLTITSRLANISIRSYFNRVIFPTFGTTVLSLILPFTFVCLVKDESFIRLLGTCVISVITTSSTVWLIGLNKMEKFFVKNKLKSFLHK